MELIVLVIFSIIFTLIKSLTEKNQGKPESKEPQFEKYPAQEMQEVKKDKRTKTKEQKFSEKVRQTPRKQQKYEELEIQVQELEDDEVETSQGYISLDRDEVVKGIIMSEVLESPRFKKPHRIS